MKVLHQNVVVWKLEEENSVDWVVLNSVVDGAVMIDEVDARRRR